MNEKKFEKKRDFNFMKQRRRSHPYLQMYET